jgi:hypothetical protein
VNRNAHRSGERFDGALHELGDGSDESGVLDLSLLVQPGQRAGHQTAAAIRCQRLVGEGSHPGHSLVGARRGVRVLLPQEQVVQDPVRQRAQQAHRLDWRGEAVQGDRPREVGNDVAVIGRRDAGSDVVGPAHQAWLKHPDRSGPEAGEHGLAYDRVTSRVVEDRPRSEEIIDLFGLTPLRLRQVAGRAPDPLAPEPFVG